MQAAAESYAAARRLAERLANVAGRRLGELTSLYYGSDSRAERMMERQHCTALLLAIAYDLHEGEVVSEDPRALELAVSVNVIHHLE